MKNSITFLLMLLGAVSAYGQADATVSIRVGGDWSPHTSFNADAVGINGEFVLRNVSNLVDFVSLGDSVRVDTGATNLCAARVLTKGVDTLGLDVAIPQGFNVNTATIRVFPAGDPNLLCKHSLDTFYVKIKAHQNVASAMRIIFVFDGTAELGASHSTNSQFISGSNVVTFDEGLLSAGDSIEYWQEVELVDPSQLTTFGFAVQSVSGLYSYEYPNGTALQNFPSNCEVSVTEIEKQPIETHMYPNPVQSGANVTLELAESGYYEFMVFDATGKVVSTISTQRQDLVNISTDGFGAGLYLIQGVETRTGRPVSGKFMVQ